MLAPGASPPLQAADARRSPYGSVLAPGLTLASADTPTVMLSIVLAWEMFKDWLSATVHLSHWSLHVILGLGVFLLAAALLRRPLRSLLPLLPVAVLELGNETLDFLRAWLPHWYWNWPDTLIEIALTLGPPLLVVLVARLWLLARLPLRRLAAAAWFHVRFPPRREHIEIAIRDDRGPRPS